MSVAQMHENIDQIDLHRYYDDIQSGCYSVPTYTFSEESFYTIMAILKRYDWFQYGGGLNLYTLKGYEITVIGSNTVYTYLGIGRDENGKAFVLSAYDDKIMYPSEADYTTIDNILRSVS